MADWKSANLSAFVPPEMDSLISTTQTVTASVSAILSVIKGFIDAIKTFLIPIPGLDFASALIAAVEAFREDFLGTGFYAANMWDYPIVQFYQGGSGGHGFEESFEQALAASFSDANDPNLPPFNSSAAMLVLVGGAPGIPGVLPVVEGIRDAFSWWTELDTSYATLSKIALELQVEAAEVALARGDIVTTQFAAWKTVLLQKLQRARRDMRDSLTVEQIQSLIDSDLIPDANSTIADLEAYIAGVDEGVAASDYPDWQQISLRTIVPPLVDVVDQVFDPLVSALQTGKSILDTVLEFIDALEAKIDQLDSIIDAIDLYLSQLDALLGATGLYALWIDTSNGIEDIKAQLQAAGNKPFAGLNNGFYFGLAIVAGGPGLTPFTNLFRPIGA